MQVVHTFGYISSATSIAARTLALMGALNVNGVLFLVTGTEAGLSVLMVLMAVYLVAVCGLSALSRSMQLYMATIGTYLVLGALFSFFGSAYTDWGRFLRSYGGSAVIVLAIAGYTARLHIRELPIWIDFLRNVFVLSAAFVWFSPLLYQLYTNLPPSASYRMGGLFGNPNEAAIASTIAIALVLLSPPQSRLTRYLFLTIGIGAVLLTFSKAGIGILLIFALIRSMVRAKNSGGIVPVLMLALLLAVIPWLDKIIFTIASDNPFGLELSQQNRLFGIAEILSGRVDERTTTGRTYLWNIVWDRALEKFPFGSGLGSGHQIVGGILELGIWQGVHSTPLMLLGEAGVIPFACMIMLVIFLIKESYYIDHRLLVATLFIPIFADWLISHVALAARFENVLLGFILGLIARGREFQSKRRLNVSGVA